MGTPGCADIPPLEGRNWLVHRHWTRCEYDACQTLIEEELIVSKGRNEHAHYMKGLVLRRTGRLRESLECFQNCYDLNAASINNVKQIAKTLYLLGSYKSAMEVFLEARKLDSSDWEIERGLGECCMKLSLPKEADGYLRKAAASTRNERPVLALARLRVACGEFPEAASLLAAVLRIAPECHEVDLELGQLYLRVNDTRQAQEQLTKIPPRGADPRLPAGFLAQERREYNAALSEYKAATLRTPDSFCLWNNIGTCFFEKEKFIAAIGCLKRAHYLDPTAVLPTFNLGMVHLSIQLPMSAAVYLCAAATIAPKYPRCFLLLAIALGQLGDEDGALKSLTEAHLLDPRDHFVIINMAALLFRKNEVERAETLLASLEPDRAARLLPTKVEKVAAGLRARFKTSGVNPDLVEQEK
ncbi:Bardet-Biedl syndrome 4 protein [Orussus abietinus]|uniref:Bardet-Biedl syndrome 4 protein n=1 Tax=Orussus abietinus TaxID=222816 RepID=UPI000C715D01|nr:Bardet-Biedl syndrome 4 protein [Orussus abietinus]